MGSTRSFVPGDLALEGMPRQRVSTLPGGHLMGMGLFPIPYPLLHLPDQLLDFERSLRLRLPFT